MNSLFTSLRARLFRSVSRKKALEIARETCAPLPGAFKLTRKKPTNSIIYGVSEDEPCWYVTVHNERSQVIQSSHVVVISRRTGKVLYNGSAFDEG
jgi:hypothetical protein